MWELFVVLIFVPRLVVSDIKVSSLVYGNKKYPYIHVTGQDVCVLARNKLLAAARRRIYSYTMEEDDSLA